MFQSPPTRYVGLSEDKASQKVDELEHMFCTLSFGDLGVIMNYPINKCQPAKIWEQMLNKTPMGTCMAGC
jgi:hypothetical protein